MFGLFMPKTELSCMSRPSSVAPMAFNLVQMDGAIVEVITDTICGKLTATAPRHGVLVSVTIDGGVRRLCCSTER